MKILNIFLLVILASVFTATSANNADNDGSDVATIVFMRSSFVGSMVKASIYEVTSEGTIFIGIMKNKKRIEYETTAGKHTFMVVSEAADFMQAEVVANKTYYSIITPRSGAWKARFSMMPIRNDGTTNFNTSSPDFAKWLKKTKVETMTDKDQAWYEKNKDSVEAKRAKYWEAWKQKSAQDMAARTLNVNDGVDRD